MLKFTCALLLLVQVLQKSFLLFRLSAVETFLYQLSLLSITTTAKADLRNS
mgnify:CR=1 FL=1